MRLTAFGLSRVAMYVNRDDRAIEFDVFGRDGFAGELGGEMVVVGGHFLAEIGVVEEFGDAFGEGVGVAGFGPEAVFGIGHVVGGTADAGRDDGEPGGDGF